MTIVIREKWATEYPGRTDNGISLSINGVVPGIFVHGEPIGYWPAESKEQVEQAWELTWVTL